jgi:hypothetical protein
MKATALVATASISGVSMIARWSVYPVIAIVDFVTPAIVFLAVVMVDVVWAVVVVVFSVVVVIDIDLVIVVVVLVAVLVVVVTVIDVDLVVVFGDWDDRFPIWVMHLTGQTAVQNAFAIEYWDNIGVSPPLIPLAQMIPARGLRAWAGLAKTVVGTLAPHRRWRSLIWGSYWIEHVSSSCSTGEHEGIEAPIGSLIQ